MMLSDADTRCARWNRNLRRADRRLLDLETRRNRLREKVAANCTARTAGMGCPPEGNRMGLAPAWTPEHFPWRSIQ
ncbi:MAG: hypothetical protein ACREDF_09680, partial [Thermoplasmata archaeon]